VYNHNPLFEKYAIGNLAQETFPGMKPQSNWPISLDELITKLNSLKMEELFYQPFDINGDFLKEAESFIKTYFEFLKEAYTVN